MIKKKLKLKINILFKNANLHDDLQTPNVIKIVISVNVAIYRIAARSQIILCMQFDI